MTWTPPTTTPNEHSVPDYTESLKKGHSSADLNALYTDGDSADQSIFAEMRSNILLVAGEHYQKRESLFHRRIRDAKELSNEQKLRLTKNHTRKICQAYVNNIMSMSPGVGFTPKDDKSPHDQKVADMHHSIWRDAFQRYNIDDCMDDWCDSFVQIGEVACKIFFDPNKGTIKGYEQATDPAGEPLLDEQGQPQHDPEKPVYTGEFVFEEIYGFNLLRPSECRDIKKAEWLCNRKMVNKDDLLLTFTSEDQQKFIKEGMDETYMVFDAAYGGYYKAKGQVPVREYYFRPCLKYPNGYFYITTQAGILTEGELPGGIFPIVIQQFDKVQTTARGRGPVKQMRPYQAEINRSASKIAEHQITLGDDKLMHQNGTKVSASVTLPGIRSVSYTGATPTILEGRSGAQYLDYMNSQITELYMVMNVAEDSQENSQNLDPYVLLFRAARQKKKFQRYIKRFEKFLIEIVKTYLSLAKVHLDDEALVYAVGTNERVNIPEFKKMPDICYEINIEAQADDVETKLGKQITINNALQYVGSQLKPEDIGKIMRQMPFADFDQTFDDMTIDFDNSVNDVLALDRGEKPPVNEYDNHVYNIKRLTSRCRKADFKYLPQPVQMAYQQKIQLHQQMEAQQQLALQRAEQGFIPTGGAMITCQMYVNNPKDPMGKPSLVRVPYTALDWLLKQLESQGLGQDQLKDMNQGAQVGIANQVMRLGGGAGAPQPGMQPPPGLRAPMGAHPMAGGPMGHMPHSPNGMGAQAARGPTGMGQGVANVGSGSQGSSGFRL